MTTAPALPRSLQFVPATRLDRVPKAFSRGADAVVVDLEDAVASAAKSEARDAVAGMPARASVWVRCNAVGTPEFSLDLDVLRGLRWLAGVVLPKVERQDDVAAVRSGTDGLAVLALVESAVGVLATEQIAAAGVHRLALGSVDLRRDLGIPQDDDERGLAHARSMLAVVSRACGLPAPVDGPVVDLARPAVLVESARAARAYGFGGKLCIHPDQIAAVNETFSPSADERAWAAEVVDAAEESGTGVFRLGDQMVDAPLVQRARNILAEIDRPPLRQY